MTGWMARIAGVLTLITTPILAQESTNTTPSTTDWSVFTEESPKQCWGVSAPKETVNTKDGKPTTVRRGDILLFVTFRSGQVGAETSFAGGYPFARGSTVEMVIDDQTFQMTTRGEYAWAMTPDDDVKLLAAMQKGAEATLTAHSAKGTQTQDTFSLSGFTAAMTEAESKCK